MQAYIKRKSDFATSSHQEVLDYEINESIYDAVSTIDILKPEEMPAEGDFVFLDGRKWLGVIGAVDTDNNLMTLTINQAITMFNREMFFDVANFTYYEDYLVSLINSEYKNQSDEEYAMPYINITALTHTSISELSDGVRTLPDIVDNKFSISSYAEKLRRLYDIYVDFEFTRTDLNISVQRRVNPIRQIDFSNPDVQIVSQEFSKAAVSKITTYCEETTLQQNWFLNDDGSITSDTPVPGALYCLQHQRLTFTDIAARDFISDPEGRYENYPYVLALTFRGVTPEMTVEITTDPDDADQTKIGMAVTGDNTIYIYASEDLDVIIPQIVCEVGNGKS